MKKANIQFLHFPTPEVSIKEEGKDFLKLKIIWSQTKTFFGMKKTNTSYPVIRKLKTKEGEHLYSWEDTIPKDLWRIHYGCPYSLLYDRELHRKDGLEEKINNLCPVEASSFPEYKTKAGLKLIFGR